MRLSDPFPLAGQGLTPVQSIDWAAMARKLVREVLRIEPHERVVLSADAYCGGAMLDEVRAELQRARAIELATILHWTPTLASLRAPDGCKADVEDARREDDAMYALFNLADVFIWLQSDYRRPYRTHATGQSEWILETWKGRSIHFHWFPDPANPDPESDINKAIDRVYQSAVLDLDYAALRRAMRAIRDRMSESIVSITNPAGTDIRFKTTARFCLNDGDASRAKASAAMSARDREEEIPCGSFRTIPDIDSVEGVIAFKKSFGFPAAGYGLDVNKWFDQGLRIFFDKGHVVRVETDGDQAKLDEEWNAQTGDKDRLGEFVLGCNPLLKPVPGSSFQPYYGFGDGVIRLTIGENVESGGANRSSLHRWLMLIDGTVKVGNETIVKDGKLTKAYAA
jgi:hypothetical protein